MQIPHRLEEREEFYAEIIRNCLASRNDRVAQYERLRAYYMWGAPPDCAPAGFNKIEPHIDLISSFLFAADTVKFSIVLGAGADKRELVKVEPLVRRLHDHWEDSCADIMYGIGIDWALVYGSMFVKLIQRGRFTHPYLVDPHNFAVLREDQVFLDRQQAFLHLYYMTESELKLELVRHPNLAAIMARVSESGKPAHAMPAGVQRIFATNLYPLNTTLQGNVNNPMGGDMMYRPISAEPLIELQELWLWDDAANDYHTATLASGEVCIYDRPNFFLPGEHPFTQIWPNPAYDYFWGYSEVQKLTALQDRRSHHSNQIDALIDLNVNPPKATTGMWGLTDEKSLAMQRIGALISSVDPVAKIQEFKPTLPPDLYTVIHEIDAEFNEASATSNILKGKGEAGVRSKGQADKMVQVGSSRQKKRALRMEDSLERIARQYVALDQRHNKQPLYYEEAGEQVKFIAEQFTKDFMVKVDAHSASPVFIDEQKNLAFDLHDRKAIDRDALLQATHPPMEQMLRSKLKQIQAAEIATEKQRQELEAGRALHSVK